MIRYSFVCILFLFGCSTRSSDTSFETVCEAITTRTSQQLSWKEGVEEITERILQEIQQEGLTQERAIQLALTNNPDLFAYYENLELAYAGLLEAGLMQNPIFSTSVRFPSQSQYHLNNLFDAAFSFLDLFLIPMRKRAAEAEIRVVEAELGQKILDLVKQVQLQWLHMKAIELQIVEEQKQVEIKQLAAALAALQKNAGNVNALSAREKQIRYEEAVEKIKGVFAELESARENLNRSLGLFGNRAAWQLIGKIDWKEEPELPSLSQMEMAAIHNRLDVEALRRQTRWIAQKAKLKQWWTYSNLMIGVSSEMQPEGFTTTGPAIALEIPIFNFGQGEKKRYRAKLKQAQKRLLSKAVQACSEVREFYKTAHQYQMQLEDLETTVLPDMQQQLATGQIHYNVMTLGIYTLLNMKEQQVQADLEKIHALKMYKSARVELLYATGGSFDFPMLEEAP